MAGRRFRKAAHEALLGPAPSGERRYAPVLDHLLLTNLVWAQSGAMDPDSGTYALTLSGSMDRAELGDEGAYGPGALEFVIRNLDPKVLAALGEAGAEEAAQVDPALLARLLERSPTMEVALLELVGPDGTLRATGETARLRSRWKT